VTIEWPDGKPDRFEMSTVLLEQMMADHDTERALSDDLADVLATHYGFTDNDEMERVLARHREARQR
jgi:hypothetical protein